ncbi:MAG: outer membrane lipoprotein carrier protein LolA [Candidatus Aminicenantes bacterium]|nr:outer membrane lipoprotein carrier protein LolA [Candidatus Aminicenantes bacterium]
MLLFLSLGYPLLHAGPEDPRVEKILSKLEEKFNETDTVSCSFTQTKQISQLKEKIVTEGKLYFKKPHYLRMEHSGGENLIIYCNGEKIWLEDLDLKEVEIFEFKQTGTDSRLSRFLPPVFSRNAEELKKDFFIQLLEDRGGPSRLEIKPRPGTGYSFLSLKFDVGSLSRLQRMKILYANGDWTEMTFRNWKSHPEISDYFFEFLKKNPGFL